MLATVHSASLIGLESYAVRVEVSFTTGLPSFAIVGLPQGAVRESRERVMAALRHVGHPPPPRRITVNLAPADVRKQGSAFDLPLAVGLLIGAGVLESSATRAMAFFGELGLDGTVRAVPGALPMTEGCARNGMKAVVVPWAARAEASAIEGLNVLPVRSLVEVIDHLRGDREIEPIRPLARSDPREHAPMELSDVRGQAVAKRAVIVAAAGAHNLLLLGPPGSGKTMLARRLGGILPPLGRAEAIDVTRIHSVAGIVPPGRALIDHRPFRAPHHTVSTAGLVGGGSPVARPGEVTLAHHGVLFLDELPEFGRRALESLRVPLEDGTITLPRVGGSVRYPATFTLVAAMNPCPCGRFGSDEEDCTCDPTRLERYRARVSGPILDRIDLHVPVSRVPFRELEAERAPADSSEAARVRVIEARRVQASRFEGLDAVHANAHMSPRQIDRFCVVDSAVKALLGRAMDRLGLSARAYHRILKVARTIADLEHSTVIQAHHAAEAIQYRSMDRTA